MSMQGMGRSNRSGQSAGPRVEHNHGFFSRKGVVVQLERRGETARTKEVVDVRNAFIKAERLGTVGHFMAHLDDELFARKFLLFKRTLG